MMQALKVLHFTIVEEFADYASGSGKPSETSGHLEPRDKVGRVHRTEHQKGERTSEVCRGCWVSHSA